QRSSRRGQGEGGARRATLNAEDFNAKAQRRKGAKRQRRDHALFFAFLRLCAFALKSLRLLFGGARGARTSLQRRPTCRRALPLGRETSRFDVPLVSHARKTIPTVASRLALLLPLSVLAACRGQVPPHPDGSFGTLQTLDLRDRCARGF